MTNKVLATMLAHRSIRKYAKRMPSDKNIKRIVRAGQQAAFAAQLYSVILTKDRDNHPFKAPLLFTICVDFYKMETIMAKRGWKWISNDLYGLLLGIQDACYMAQNMVLAAESLGLGTCYLGHTPFASAQLAKKFKLPKRVFPLVQIAMGYPAENPPVRPRYPMDFVLFEGKYPALDRELVAKAMKAMDDGYLAQGYYRKSNMMLTLISGKKETFDFDTYSWTEHISRKWGQWYPSAKPLRSLMRKRGFKF
ncbi:MAG: nitroreductase family protein [Candidatus Edwardsbacteria bacterium]|nr:nitroreductase family protein [Candidatus Edwardsbacteria bacterium]